MLRLLKGLEKKSKTVELIVKPSLTQETVITKKEICTNINLVDLKINSASLLEKKNGTVIIKCTNNTDLDKIKNKLNEKMSDKYSMYKYTPFLPRIKIIGKFPSNDKQVLEEKICSQNFQDLEDSYFKLLHIKDNKQKKFTTLFAEVNKITYNCIATNKRIAIQFERYKVYDDFNVLRCYKCCHYGHSKNNCKSKVEFCFKCSAQHKTSECSSNEKLCVNCSLSNKNFNTAYKCDHHATDKNCPVYITMKEKKIKLTDYDTQPSL